MITSGIVIADQSQDALPAKLMDDMQKGKVVLLTGTGMSIGGKNKFNNDIISTSALADLLAKSAGFPYNNEPLKKVMNAARPRIGDAEIASLFRDNFMNCRPSTAIQAALRFTWKRFYTFNVDDTINNTPMSSRRQHLNFFNGMSARREEWKSFADLQVIYLHGKADALENGIVFSETDYAETSAFSKPWYDRLGEDFSEFTVLCIGSSLDEPLFRQHVARHRPLTGFTGESYLVTPSDLSPIDKASLDHEQIKHLRYTADQFFEALLRSFRSGIGPNDVLKATSLPTDGSLTLEDLERLRSFAPVNSEAINKFVSNNEADAPRFRKLFFEGFGPNWHVILKNEIAELESFSDMENKIVANISTEKAIVISGEAGCGKSTFALWIALRLSQKQNLSIFQYIPRQSPFLDSMSALSRHVGDRGAVVVVDDLYLYAKEIREVLVEPRFRNIHVISTARSGEWASRIGFDIEDRVFRLEMPRFAVADIHPLINKIDRFYPAPEFSQLSLEKKIERFGRSKEQLLIALKEATYGAGFDQIIEDEVERIEEPLTRLTLVIASICTLPRTGLAYAAASSVLGRLGGGKNTLASGLRQLQGIVEIDQGGRLKARHELYARQVIEKHIKLPEYEKALTALITYFTQFRMPVIRSVNQIDGRLFRFLLNNRNVYDAYARHGEAHLAAKLYERFEVALQQDGHFWLQYALLLRRLRKQKRALDTLVKSLQAYPQNVFAVHALAQQKLIVATFAEKYGAYEQRLTKEAVESLMAMHSGSVSDKTIQFDEYPIVTLGYSYVNLLVKHGMATEAVREAKKYFSMLDAIPNSSSDFGSLKADLLMFVTQGKWVRLELKQGSLALQKVAGGRSGRRKSARRIV